MKVPILIFIFLAIFYNIGIAQNQGSGPPGEFIQFQFEGNTISGDYQFSGDQVSFAKGIDGQCLLLKANGSFNNLALENLPLDGIKSFSVQFWLKTSAKNPTVFLSQKDFTGKGIASQKNAGWALYSSHGSFAWSIGSGERRLSYERDNGDKMPIADGLWHQIIMTYDKELSEIRLYYDGNNKAIYKVGFDFSNTKPLVIGAKDNGFDYDNEFLPSINQGVRGLQNLVDEFNRLNVEPVTEGEFFSLIVDAKELYLRKLKLEASEINKLRDQKLEILDKVNEVKGRLHNNPYTVSQNSELTALKPVSKIYYLRNGEVHINEYYGKFFTMKERLYASNFAMDNLTIWPRAINAVEVQEEYKKYQRTKPSKQVEKPDTLVVAVWNIWHGGKHFTMDKNGWDSRIRIVELFKKYKVDIILMQETYSSGDFIAAELGYYFATTSDWDYRLQGSNIAVLSRYPIRELAVPEKAEFMNVSAKIALSETQHIYAMSNWYGMSAFPDVFNFHLDKFSKADEIPILFGGDFNAVPHTDGGSSEASTKLLENGFKDAYRSLHTDIKTFPGYTHQWGKRIDQLYYKGKGLINISTEVISTASGGFPSDHFMILSKFLIEN